MIISVIAKTFSMDIYLIIIICMFYFICIVMFVSTLLEKQSLTNFLGIVIGFLIPLLGLYSTISNSKGVFKIIKYIFPYYYILKQGCYLVVPILIGLILIITSLKILDRKDL